ncbi:hypothetical protein HYZ41_02395 [archaeon]|nr:hypothetical protein [archaeon]
MKHILFVCRVNVNRSKLAEELYKNDNRYEVRSAGIYDINECVKHLYPNSRKLTDDDISWADEILTFFTRDELLAMYPTVDKQKVIDLEIYDEYRIDNPDRRNALTKVLIGKLKPYLGEPQNIS